MQGVDLSAEQRDAAARRARARSAARRRSTCRGWAAPLRFDFGDSLLYSRPVSDLVGERALNTAVLATVALLLATLIGIPLGIYTGTRSGVGAIDRARAVGASACRCRR